MPLKDYLEATGNALGNALSIYLHTLVRTLTNPKPAFRPVLVSAEEQGFSTLSLEPAQSSRLNPGLFHFAITSVVLGTLLKSIGGSMPDTAGMATATVVVLIFWLFLSGVAHALAHILGGGASIVESVTVTIQIFAAVYVLANFLGLLFFLITGTWVLAAVNQAGFSTEVATFIGTARGYFLIQGILLAIYLPFAIRNTHRLGWVRAVLVFGLIAVTATLLNIFLYKVSGHRVFYRKDGRQIHRLSLYESSGYVGVRLSDPAGSSERSPRRVNL